MCPPLNQLLRFEEFSGLIGQVWSNDPPQSQQQRHLHPQVVAWKWRRRGVLKEILGAVTKERRNGPEQSPKNFRFDMSQEKEPYERLGELERRGHQWQELSLCWLPLPGSSCLTFTSRVILRNILLTTTHQEGASLSMLLYGSLDCRLVPGQLEEHICCHFVSR